MCKGLDRKQCRQGCKWISYERKGKSVQYCRSSGDRKIRETRDIIQELISLSHTDVKSSDLAPINRQRYPTNKIFRFFEVELGGEAQIYPHTMYAHIHAKTLLYTPIAKLLKEKPITLLELSILGYEDTEIDFDKIFDPQEYARAVKDTSKKGHANILFVDSVNKFAYRYDPHGVTHIPYKGKPDTYIGKTTDRLLTNYFKGIGIQYKPPLETACPVQGIEGRLPRAKGEPEGFCVAWSMLKIYLLFKFTKGKRLDERMRGVDLGYRHAMKGMSASQRAVFLRHVIRGFTYIFLNIAGECKTLAKPVCKRAKTCSWVDAKKRKPHCRKKAKRRN